MPEPAFVVIETEFLLRSFECFLETPFRAFNTYHNFNQRVRPTPHGEAYGLAICDAATADFFGTIRALYPSVRPGSMAFRTETGAMIFARSTHPEIVRFPTRTSIRGMYRTP